MPASVATKASGTGTGAPSIDNAGGGSSDPCASDLGSAEALVLPRAGSNGARTLPMPPSGTDQAPSNFLTPGLSAAMKERAVSGPYFPKIKSRAGQRAVSARGLKSTRASSSEEQQDLADDKQYANGTDMVGSVHSTDNTVEAPGSCTACGAEQAAADDGYKGSDAAVIGADTLQAAKTESVTIDEATIREVVENAVEQQVAAALSPLRLIIGDLKLILANNLNQNSDLDQHNEILSRQLDVQYRDIQRTAEVFHCQTQALIRVMESMDQSSQNAAGQMTTAKNLVGYLTQMISNLPLTISQAVTTATASATATITASSVATAAAGEMKSALERIMAAQQESIRNVDIYFEQQCTIINQYRNHVAQELTVLKREHSRHDFRSADGENEGNAGHGDEKHAGPSPGKFNSFSRRLFRLGRKS
ncbi:hypothetical protein CDD82_323 [Ophiocordyceps australis]|uniref:Uncharacterized protein n=1 Tax=Ophiocordyceps australis TaxID=1399860 RepID=A0A2C5ZP77_9HYPO|nr:hypothetical protein CDD82_323 [Ophiocordyceps australis]